MKTSGLRGYEFQSRRAGRVTGLTSPADLRAVRRPQRSTGHAGHGHAMRRRARRPTQTVSFIPGRAPRPASAAGNSGHSAAPGKAGGTELQRLPTVHGSGHAERRQAPAGGGARHGTRCDGPRHLRDRPGGRRAVLNTLHRAPVGPAPAAQSVPARTTASPAAATRQRLRADDADIHQLARSPAHWPVQIVQPSPSPSPPSPLPKPSRSRSSRCAASIPAPPRPRQRCAPGAVPTPPSGSTSAGERGPAREGTSPPAGCRPWPAWAGASCRPTSGRRRRAGAAAGESW